MSSEILKKIKQKIEDKKELYSVFTNPEEIKSINSCINIIKSNGMNSEESDILQDIYQGLYSMFADISKDWKNNQDSLSSKKIDMHYQNLGSILEIVTLIKGLNEEWRKAFIFIDFNEFNRDIEPLRKKMREALEKMQQQKSQKELFELEKKSKEEFGKYIENGTIDEISIKKYSNQDRLYTIIKLKEDNKSTDIQVSEFLNSDFCKKNNINEIRILNGDQEEIVCGFVDNKGKRCYDLGTTVQYGIKFSWYVGGKEHNITLGANSDGNIRVVGDIPSDEDLEKNKDVRIKVCGEYLTLAEAVKTCRQQEDPSSTVKQASANEHCRPLVRTSA
ncbi:hypothetical protein [Wolbachia endosymbiont of Rhagoletis cingulata]|uniref:hypothetical protein n=1 Tax=Wolbachia endosymbiont of Rhagoletis cingulata TaxID=1220542 RepID=UPI003AF3851B